MKRSGVDEVCIFEYMYDDCSFVFVINVVLHNLTAFQLLKRLTVCMMKNQYIARFRILFKEKILLLVGFSL